MHQGWTNGLKAAVISAALCLAGTGFAQTAEEPVPAPAITAQTTDSATDTTVAPAEAAAPAYTRMMPTPGIGQPIPRGIDVQQPVTPVAEQASKMLHYVLNPVIFAICVLVLGLMTWVILRYRASVNPTASRTSHHFTIEVIWTVIPAVILLFIAFPSFRLLATQYNPPMPDLTIKVTGYQWYWGYEYPDYGGVALDSLPLTKEEAEAEGTPYLLEVDNRLVVPAGKNVKLLITAADVLHSFAVPSFWVKMDAVPGRINESWFRVDRPGVYYGQCSELCGTKHGFMPIAIEVLPEEEFLAWMRMKQQEAGIDPAGPGIAAAEEATASNDITATDGVLPTPAPAA